MKEHMFALVSEAIAAPAGVLMTVNGALAVAVTALYRDCKKDREKLWKHISDLEKRISR